jgi:hypothetical protein
MPIADGDILRAVAKMSFGASDVQNVYHIKCDVITDPGDTSVLAAVIDALNTAYDYIDTLINDDISFDTIGLWNVTTETFIGEDDWSTLTAGGGTGTNLPVQCSPMVLFNTNVNRSQGRKFLPIVATGSLTADGVCNSTLLTALGGFATYLLNGITGTGWSGAYGNWNPDLLRFVEWATAYVSQTLKTQRRRYVGSGS